MLAEPVPADDVLHLLDDRTRGRLPERGRDAAASAHALLRCVLTELTGIAPSAHAFTRCCAICSGPHGKPELTSAPLHTSLSYTPVGVAVAVTATAPVGVDVESICATDFAGFADVALAPGESARTLPDRARAWTRKEALLKATGTGLAVDPRTVDVRGRTTTTPLAAQLYDVPAPTGSACAVAVLGADRPALRVQQRRLRAAGTAAPVARATP